MKRLLLILAATSALQAEALERKYAEGYTFESLPVNTDAKEEGLSLYKDKVAFSQKDSTYLLQMADSIGKLADKKEADALLTDIKAEGQFAYDKSKEVVYVSKDGELYAISVKEGDKFSPKKLEIDGLSGGRKDFEKGSQVAYRRWRYKSPTIKGLYNPNLSADGKKLYFTAEFDGGKGGKDIWYTTPNTDGTWSAPVNVAEVNTASDEDYAFVSGDSLLYFSSNRKDTLNGWNVYKSRLKGDKTPKMLPEGVNSNSNDLNFVGNSQSIFVLTDRGGNQDIYSPHIQPVVIETPAPDTVVADTQKVEEVVPEKKTYNLNEIVFYFQYDNEILIRNYDDEIAYAASYIKSHPNKTFVIYGHTDARGTQKYNQALSVRRTEAIYQRLISEGVSAKQLKRVGEGKRQLAVPNAMDEESHQKNRRVTIKAVNKK